MRAGRFNTKVSLQQTLHISQESDVSVRGGEVSRAVDASFRIKKPSKKGSDTFCIVFYENFQMLKLLKEKFVQEVTAEFYMCLSFGFPLPQSVRRAAKDLR